MKDQKRSYFHLLWMEAASFVINAFNIVPTNDRSGHNPLFDREDT